jgi:hypothetical protein
MRIICVLLLAVLAWASEATAAAAEKPKPAYDPIDQYETRRLEGWTLRINKRLLTDDRRELRDKTLRVLGDQLFQITRVVPAEALAKLRKITIWVELNDPHHPCMCYHPDAGWLREHGMNPDKARCVELANARNFNAWTLQQPWMVLHELAHGYHHQVLDFDNAEIRACFDAAVRDKLYESVLNVRGRKSRHYALSNAKEYFAEMTEAYFGTNDFYPFVRAELLRVDPRMHDLLEKVWHVRKKRPNEGKSRAGGNRLPSASTSRHRFGNNSHFGEK